MTSLETFFPLVAGRLPGCPRATLSEALLASCIEFCERTRLLIATVDIDVSPGERFSFLSAPNGLVCRVDSLTRGENQRLEPSSRREFELYGYDVKTGSPVAYYVEGDGQLVLGPVPDAAETLIASVVTRPADNATQVEDALYSDWRYPIAAGARAYVRTNFDPWFNPDLEAFDRAAFESAVAEANLKRAKGSTQRPLRVRGHYF